MSELKNRLDLVRFFKLNYNDLIDVGSSKWDLIYDFFEIDAKSRKPLYDFIDKVDVVQNEIKRIIELKESVSTINDLPDLKNLYQAFNNLLIKTFIMLFNYLEERGRY